MATTLSHPVTLDGAKVYITQEFGDDFAWQGKTQFYRQQYGLQGHNGIDYGGTHIHGHPVTAAADGTVVYAGLGDYWDSTVGGGAHVVILDHGDILTGYLHLIANSQTVAAGQRVKRGQTIGKAGNTGVGTGSHLHFQVMPKPFNRWNNWGCVDPRRYLTTATAAAGNTIKPIQEEEDMAYTDWPKKDQDALADAVAARVWQFTNPNKAVSLGKDAYWWLRNPGYNTWRTQFKSVNGKMYQAAAFLINNNTNGWKIPGIQRLLEKLAERNGLTKTDLDNAVSQINDHTDEAMTDAVIDVDVTVNRKEKS